MKAKLGVHTVDFDEKTIRATRRDVYLRRQVKALRWLGVGEDTLVKVIGEVYDTVKSEK